MSTQHLGTRAPARVHLLATWAETTGRIVAFGALGAWQMRPSAHRQRAANRRVCAGCRRRHHEVVTVLALLAALQLTGVAAWAVHNVRTPICQPPASSSSEDAARYTRHNSTLLVQARQVITAGPTGLALLYANTRHADICRFAPNGNLIARMGSGYARGGTMYGHVYLTYPKPEKSYEDLLPLTRHEARHTGQWAVGTALTGPLGFPIAYSLDESISPGAHNHFERHAGLADGGYPVPDGPSPMTSRLTLAAAALAITAFERHRIRRHLALLTALIGLDRRTRRGTRHWWHNHTHPVPPGPATRLLERIAHSAAGLVIEHRRLRQMGCAHCGQITVPGAASTVEGSDR